MRARRVKLAGQTWTVTMRALAGFGANGHVAMERMLLVAQLLVTWLVAILASVLIRARGRDGIVMRQLAQAHRETENERRRLQSIFDASSVAIFFVDARGVITQANKRMAEMFGCTVEALQGAEYVSLIHPSEREIGRDAFETEIRRRGFHAMEIAGQYIILCNTGQMRVVC